MEETNLWKRPLSDVSPADSKPHDEKALRK